MTDGREVIGYMSGPVDGPAVYRQWKDGRALDYFGTSYLSQFLSVVRDRDARAVVITYLDAPDSRTDIDDVTFYNVRRHEYSGLAFHRDLIRRIARSARILIDEGVGTAVMSEGTPYWFAAAALGRHGVRVLPALHGQAWTTTARRKLSHRLLDRLNRRLFFRPLVGRSIVASGAIARQVIDLTGRSNPSPAVFMPTYERASFAAVSPPARSATEPFVILVAGRMEADKGIYDMAEVASRLAARGLPFELHYCGDGTQRQILADDIARRGLSGLVTIHGFCGRDRLTALFSRSHAIVVPTRSELEEGFAMICAEGVLAGRPVVTSRVCPALEYILPAAVEVPPDDIAAYTEALARLITNPDFYAEKVAATAQCQEQFYDSANSYGAKLAEALGERR